MADDSTDTPSGAPSLEDTILQFLSLVGPAGTAPSSFAALCDGIYFFDVLHHLDAAHFDTDSAGLKREAHDNALLRISNLRKLVAALQAFFATSNLFGTADVDLSFLNVTAIGQASGGSNGELLKLAELVVTAAVNSGAKEAVVAHIMELSEDQQHQLMFIINEVMEKHAPPDEAAVAAGASSLGTPGLRPFDAPSPRHSLSPRHVSSRDDSRELKELRDAVAEARPKLDRLSDENRELRRSLAVAEEKLAELSANVKRQVAEAVSAAQKALVEEKNAEVNKAKRQAESLERRVAEMSLELTRSAEHSDSLSAKLREDLEAQKLENRKLHDELDLANEKARQLVQAEATIERYKARLGELAEIRAQLKEYEEQQSGHLERIAELEAENKQVATLKQQIAKQKDEQTVLKDKLYQHELAEQELHDKLEHLKETQTAHEAEIKRVSEERDQLRAELNANREHGGDSAGSSLFAAGRTQSISDLTGALGGSSITEKLLKLEAENRELRAKAAAAGSDDSASVEQLKEELENTKRQLSTLQEKHRETNKQLLKLQTSAPAAPAPTQPSAGADDDKRRLAGEVAALQERLVTLMDENSAVKDKAKADEKRQADYEVLQKRCKELSEYGKKAKDELKKRNDVIQKLTEQNQALVTKARQDGGSAADAGNSATVKTLTQQLLDARAEIEQFKKLREEYKAVTKREMQLMSSAFYSIGTELQTQVHLYGKGRGTSTQSGSASGSTPHRNSWLNKQRGIVRH